MNPWGGWCFRQYWSNKNTVERTLKQTIINLSQMRYNTKFKPEHSELIQIAEKLIKNEKVEFYVPLYSFFSFSG